MYHYLKWAALSYFFKRNLRYLVLIAAGVVGIYIADAVYEDLADFATRTGATQKIAFYLTLKWIAVVAFGALILFSIVRLGFASPKEKRGFWGEKRKSSKPQMPKIDEKTPDPVMQRLEKFRNPKPLRRKADVVIGKKKKV